MPIYQEIYDRLREVARNGDLITYSEIAPLADLNMEHQIDRTRMGDLLGEISTFENDHGRPMLSAIVVLSGVNVPGEGFFKLARFLGLYRGQREFDDLEFFVQEVKRVHSYWKDH